MKGQKIKYDVCINVSKYAKLKEISFEDIDSYDFEHKGFVEFLFSDSLVHLYFDFDNIKNYEDYYSVCEWLGKLSEVFGECSMGGYCDNDEMAAEGFRKYEAGGHWLSMHVVFYETCISTSDLVKIMNHENGKGFTTKGVHPLCDSAPYKLTTKRTGEKSRQAFRHVLSDKLFSEKCKEQNKMNHGYILGDLKPSTQIIQIRFRSGELNGLYQRMNGVKCLKWKNKRQ